MANAIVSVADEVTLVRNQLLGCQRQFAEALPEGGMGFDKLKRSVLVACNSNNRLLEADRGSLLASAMSAAMVGLEINPILGHGYLVPFKGKCQFIPGFGGYSIVSSNSLILISGRTVHENDEFDFADGTEPRIHHRPHDHERGAVTHAYAVASSRHYPTIVWVMNLAEICAVRDRSAGYKHAVQKGKHDSTWHTEFTAMARKTPYRAIAKQLPLRTTHLLAGLEDQHDLGRHAYINRHQDLVTGDDVGPEMLT